MTPVAATPPTDRRESIADAAIAVLAADGSRGLSHRAVDQYLGLATGSTSYYFRTREALIDAAVTRLVELDDADLSAVLPPTATHGTDVLGDLFARWSSPESRVRLAARFELLLSERLHDGRHPLHEARQHFTERARVGLTAAGVADVKLKTLTLIALFDGLLLDVLISGGANRDSAYRILAELQQGLSGAGGPTGREVGPAGLEPTTPAV